MAPVVHVHIVSRVINRVVGLSDVELKCATGSSGILPLVCGLCGLFEEI